MNKMTLTYLILGLLALIAVISGQWAGGLTVMTLLVATSVLQRILNTLVEILSELQEMNQHAKNDRIAAMTAAATPGAVGGAAPDRPKRGIPNSSAFMDALDERIKG